MRRPFAFLIVSSVVASSVVASCGHSAGKRLAGARHEDASIPASVLARLASEGEDPAALVRELVSRKTPSIAEVGEVPVTLLRADGSKPDYLVHPQGLAWLPATRRWAISAVEIRREPAGSGQGTVDDRNGEGRAYVFFADALGRIDASRTVELSVREGAFHPGGIDAFAGDVFVSLSPYVPNSRAELVRVSQAAPARTTSFAVLDDHIGLVTVSDEETGPLVRAASWDARRWYTLDLEGRVLSREDSPLRLAFQDGRGVPGTGRLVWTGVVNPGATAFGVALLRARGRTLAVERTIEWPTEGHLTPGGRAPLHNAAFVWADREGRIWSLAMPDDQHGRFRPRRHEARADDAPEVDHDQGRGTALRLYRISPTPP